jgi:hypothetical protein
MGSKFGMNHLDHGYLLLNNLVVDKNAFLSRYIQIDNDGNVIGL